MNPVIVIGGYGTFGALVCRELAVRGISLAIAGRDREKATAFATSLGTVHEGVALDLARPELLRALLAGRSVAVNCAGPFREFDTGLLEACLSSGCHSVDIADDRRYAATVRSYGGRFAGRGLTAAWGCSSLPAISGALLEFIRARLDRAPARLRVSLFIGNDNPKGQAAVASLVTALGRPIAARQGNLRSGWGWELVSFPAPFGRRAVFNFDSPDYDLFDADVITVKVGFELGVATLGLSLMARSGWRFGPQTARFATWFGNLLKGVGCSGGAVMVEAFFANHRKAQAVVVAPTDGQRMAALPCALATVALLDGAKRPGACTGYELLGSERLLRELVSAGFALRTSAFLARIIPPCPRP